VRSHPSHPLATGLQIICPRPLLDVLNLGNSRVDVDDWNNQIGVVGKFAKLIALSHRLQVTGSHHIRRWSNGRALDDAGCGFQRRLLTTVYSAVGVPREEVGQPVVETWSGRSSSANLSIRVVCLTVSKAELKSTET
jgi:hypothetical protein